MLAACSGSAPVVTAPSPTGSPNEATLLICGDEASEEIADQLGVQRTDALNPVWQPPLYSCKYNYAGSATMVLSVRQLDDEAAAAKFLTGTATTVADDPGAVA